jgi:serine/threonine protein kinase
MLGDGAFADVYNITEKKTKTIYAAKFIKIPKGYMNSLDSLSFERELDIMKNCNHPLTIKFVE